MGKLWLDENLRLQAAQKLQTLRLKYLCKEWTRRDFSKSGFDIPSEDLLTIAEQSERRVQAAPDVEVLLTEEGRLTKVLYKFAALATGYGEFSRVKRGAGIDPANRFLDHGNYLAYGLGATATWVLGLPHGLSVLHGKTRRGGLVFDAADLIKDALILPQAFMSSMKGDTEQEFRQTCIENIIRSEALDYIIDTLKEISENITSKTA